MPKEEKSAVALLGRFPTPSCRLQRAKPRLVAALDARLNRYNDEIEVLRARSLNCKSDAELDLVLARWDRAWNRSEMTRRALIRTREGMPYWKWAALRTAELEADGFFLQFSSRHITPIALRPAACSPAC